MEGASVDPPAEAAPGQEAVAETPPDRYTELWTAVQESDAFETWEQLIAETLKTGDVDKVRTVLDHFLAKFPLCYGYWQKYANAESSLGDTASTEAVLERAVAATPYSIEIWLHYIAWKRKQPDCSDESVRSLFERSRAYAENDWNSHKLWDKWVEFESSRDVAHLAHVYLTATALPINQLARFQQSLTEFAGAHELAALVPADQVAAIVERARTIKAAQPPKPEPVADATNATDETTAAAPAAAEAAAAVKTESADNDEAPPGVEGGDDAMEAVNTEAKAAAVIEVSDAEAKEQWLAEVAAVTKSAAAARDLRAPYEKRIRRFWWHYKPLDATQLLTWWQYLDFLGAQGDSVTPLQMRGLYERCLVACGSYPEFWCRYIRYLSDQGLDTDVHSAITRSTATFCSKRPDMLLFAALLHEVSGRATQARELLQKLHGEIAPRSLEVVSRFANYERRAGNVSAGTALYEAALAEELSHGDSDMCTYLALQYAAYVRDASARAADAQGGEGAQEDEGATVAAGKDGAAAIVQRCLDRFPERMELWQGAIATAEAGCWGADRCDRVLDVYTQAVHAQRKVPKPAEADEQQKGAALATAEAAEEASEAAFALSLRDREELVAKAAAFADTCTDVAGLWRCHALLQELQVEFLAVAEEARSKRAAQAAAWTEPAAKRQAMDTAAAVAPVQPAQAYAAAPVDPNTAYYAQQPAYDYSAYYAQQGYAQPEQAYAQPPQAYAQQGYYGY